MPIVTSVKLGGPPWPTLDPFLFCVHHDDAYPAGNADLGPAASLEGRNIGMDFAGIDGWRMYHGDVVPGFPRHPHRGFETVTLGRAGFVDHSDSLGATARFGPGDVQWMTAGRGIVHAEMFPLVQPDAPNPGGLFQLWLNLPAADKMVEPHFTMLWRESIPVVRSGGAVVKVFAGSLEGHDAPAPPPHSWASHEEADIAIWSLELEPGAKLTLPPATPEANRLLYHVGGGSFSVAGTSIEPGRAVQVRADAKLDLGADTQTELLLLQGRPIGEPVVHHGPFVMNTKQEIEQAIVDYRRTQYGGWPWDRDDPVHAGDKTRFAIHADGREDRPSE